MFQFSALFNPVINAPDEPIVWSRRFPCRCVNCRAGLGEIHCSFLLGAGFSVSNNVAHKKTWTISDTQAKELRDKTVRKEKAVKKAVQLIMEASETPMTVETALAVAQAVAREQIENANQVAHDREGEEGAFDIRFEEPEEIDEDEDFVDETEQAAEE